MYKEIKSTKIYVRIYIEPESMRVAMCETDMLPIDRPPIRITHMDPETHEIVDTIKYIVTQFTIEDLTDGNLPRIKASEFAEDLSDDGEAKFGQSIIKINNDYTVEFDNEKAKNNLGEFKSCRGMKIINCEVIDYGT